MKLNTLSWTLVVTLAAAVAGCGDSNQPAKTTNKTGQPPAESAAHHGHGPGPHEGTLADWGGGKYHVEFTVDHEKQQATVYLLGDDEKTHAPIKADEIQLTIQDPKMQVKLVAAPLDDDPPGTASRFVGTDPGLGAVQEYAGTITGVVDGTPYAGDFKEEPHPADHKE